MYICPECGKQSKSRFEHLKHLFTAHPEKYWYVEGRWMYGMYTEDMPGC